MSARSHGTGFKFYGGHLALDFTNTIPWRLGEAREDKLRSYEDLVRWSRQAGLLDPATAASLRRAARRTPEEAERVLRQAIEIREVTYRLFEALLRGARPSDKDVKAMNGFVRGISRGARIQWTGNGFGWTRPGPSSEQDVMLEPIIRSAIDLLTSKLSSRISQCRDDRGCGWLFLDRSRSKARQWCSMSDCGNRAKARRHHHRTA